MAEAAAPVGGRVVDPDGTIHYDFDGHVRARGVDLTTAPTFATPETLPVDSVVDWVQAGGGVAARIWGREGGVLRLAGDSEVRARAELGGGLAIERTLIRDDGYSDFVQPGDIGDVVRGDPGLRITPQHDAGFGIAGGSFTDIDIDFGVPLTGNVYLPLTALLEDPAGATDRCNHPTYTEVGPTTLRFRISTDWTGTVTGTLVVHLLYYG